MTVNNNRRSFLIKSAQATSAAAALSMLPPSIRKAFAIPAHHRKGTIEDVEHIVVFTQENRSFDHYFGAMRGVRGFGDRFPIPVPNVSNLTGKTVWYQRFDGGTPAILSPQHNDTGANFSLIRTADTPHLYPDAQGAWDGGRMSNWPQYKKNASMVYYTDQDIPFQYALANAFTICDHNHCSFTGGTNPNRCYIYTGTNHGRDNPNKPGVYNGPALDNSYNNIANGPIAEGYTWTTYAERLQAAGITWQVYKPSTEDYSLNSLLGFKNFRDANAASPATRTQWQQQLYARGIQTRELSDLKADVMAGTLPQVSWICATSSGSEHPSASSPLQGANYIAEVLDALTANPDVWSKTVLLLHFDENDGFFDHVPPPAPPSYSTYDPNPARAQFAGASTVNPFDDYLGDDVGGITSTLPYVHHPYGMGPRVPMYVVSPWSRGGWVNSQVFDHTSTIRFIEKRFGVFEPNISPWRRAVAGDLTSCFDFRNPNNDSVMSLLPPTADLDAKSRTLTKTTTPVTPAEPSLPVQETGVRRSRALPYELHTSARVPLGGGDVELIFANSGDVAAVFHVYDRNHLDALPRRYTVEPGKQLSGHWDVTADNGAYDLWVLGPAGYHRHFTGRRAVAGANPEVQVAYDPNNGNLYLKVHNTGFAPVEVTVTANAYFDHKPWTARVEPRGETIMHWPLQQSGHWYDFTLTAKGLPGYTRRFAGRVETGKDGISDPALGGNAIGNQLKVSA
ncbi:phosphocholine-specific phospholipase C [Paraburkholderia caballeronis]|uniref:phospholipase C n=1 Tax=Paraburkholderia caballeronis TaxID=416943 RepID=A0A1H7F2K4_9BURK|nr:phospholipase C, phosphocholine-specific [Paraburkholderia caballeronis]PXW14585.1 phospholipase C [Paraburkholderia caballeronis]PXW93330.1 phospholipase C [Paraburkholderia caballeronis]RAJ87234.1 phospholipase C [Paraburkholderia caballeronis]SEE81084.1 phospholipase C [Paraburkholderia caballeronis]SEK18250.1 phospholipase C [Paraburkholderia caballeronis]